MKRQLVSCCRMGGGVWILTGLYNLLGTLQSLRLFSLSQRQQAGRCSSVFSMSTVEAAPLLSSLLFPLPAHLPARKQQLQSFAERSHLWRKGTALIFSSTASSLTHRRSVCQAAWRNSAKALAGLQRRAACHLLVSLAQGPSKASVCAHPPAARARTQGGGCEPFLVKWSTTGGGEGGSSQPAPTLRLCKVFLAGVQENACVCPKPAGFAAESGKLGQWEVAVGQKTDQTGGGEGRGGRAALQKLGKSFSCLKKPVRPDGATGPWRRGNVGKAKQELLRGGQPGYVVGLQKDEKRAALWACKRRGGEEDSGAMVSGRVGLGGKSVNPRSTR